MQTEKSTARRNQVDPCTRSIVQPDVVSLRHEHHPVDTSSPQHLCGVLSVFKRRRKPEAAVQEVLVEWLRSPGEPIHWTWLADSALALTVTSDDAFTCSVNTLGPPLPHPFVAVTLMALVPTVGIPLSSPVAAFNVAQPGNPVALQAIAGSPAAVNVYE